MKPTAWRNAIWPLCPICGQDELAVLRAPLWQSYRPPTGEDLRVLYLALEMFCYSCSRITVEAGEAIS